MLGFLRVLYLHTVYLYKMYSSVLKSLVKISTKRRGAYEEIIHLYCFHCS